ncbi:hypothetical protein PRZ48_005059 [Zasmidium cellare]|uniref:Pentatricopeptide repeat-containing protein n=1 Tax=Zasmidium cellare TaxID=395010 RepID=A0ABR0ETH3_ZASCE|nr:hypothetical protein PRZ48_005059 [Zasmidium cellare]
MQRTGSHVQLGSGVLTHGASGNTEQPFSSMSLLGSPLENAAALKILPRYVEVVNSNVGQRTKDLEDLLRSTDKSYWDEQDTLSEAEIETLEDALDQVTGSTDRPRDPAIPIRALWTADRLKKDASIPPERLLQRPTFRTAARLTTYIERLTDKRPRQVMQRLFRHKQHAGSYVWHVNIVTEELETLLTDEVLMQELAASALDRALQYLTKHSKYHVFRKIFAFLEHNGYEFTVSNWNVLLAAAAKAGDVFNFRYILKCMIDRKVPRTPVTWALFHDLMSRRFPLEAGTVVEIMRKKGLLVDNKAASLIAANSAGNELTAHLAMNGDLESFYRLYDNRFGLSYGRFDFEWLSINVVNRMCGVLLATGKVHDAFTVVGDYLKRNGMKNRRVALEITTLNIFLTSALRERNPATAVAMLQRFRVSQPGAVAPDHITYQILFTIAWRQKHYNMLRVIWRYACAAGHVGYAMQSRIQAGMLFRSPKEFLVKETGGMGRLWVAIAAKFAAGLQELEDSTDSHSKGPSRTAASHNSSAIEATLMRLLSPPHMHQDPSEYGQNKEEAEQILASDLSQVQKVAPVLPFPDLLEEALEKDMDWQQRGFGGPKGYIEAGGAPQMFEKMLREGIKVPVKKGDYTKYARPWEVPRLLFDRRVNDRA